MIGFSHPLILLLALPWALGNMYIARRQLAALHWLMARVSPRFLADFTRSTPASLAAHMVVLFVAGGLLIIAGAGPWRMSKAVQTEESTEATTILIIDASLSMGAGDGGTHPETGAEFKSRLNQARILCEEIIAALPASRFALLSFAGDTVVHSPPTNDHHALRTVLRSMRVHYYSTSSGSRFSTAFDAVNRITTGQPGSYHVVLISDGEISAPDDFSDGVRILGDRGIPVHTVAVGSAVTQAMNVYVLEDVLAGTDEPRIATEYRTRRDKKNLRAMSRKTGGHDFVTEYGAWASDIVPLLRDPLATDTQSGKSKRLDLSIYPITAFLLLFLFETLAVPGRRRQHTRSGISPWQRPGTTVTLGVIVLSVMSSGCGHPTLRAHRLNETGIELQRNGEHAEAIRFFERSAAYGFRDHIPTFNAGNSHLAQGDVSSAHSTFQDAIKRSPRMAEATFNDGYTLYIWGERETDPSGCQLDRTRELWEQAIRRFEQTSEIDGPTSRIGAAALANAAAIRGRLDELEILAENCPESSSDPAGPSADDPPPTSGGSEEDEPRSASLTAEEEQTISAELDRIRSSAEAAGSFRQNKQTQLDPDSAAEGDGNKIWW